MGLLQTTGRWVGAKAGKGGAADDGRTALEALTAYIPAEAIAVFLALVAIIDGMVRIGRVPGPVGPIPAVTPFHLYVACAVLVVPLIVWLAAKVKARAEGVVLTSFPVWPLVSGMLAFFAWGLTVPGVANDPLVQIIAAPVAIILSTFMSLIEKAFI